MNEYSLQLQDHLHQQTKNLTEQINGELAF